MWVEQVIRNGVEAGRSERIVDWIDVEWHECGRVLKKQSRGGFTVRVVLARAQAIRHGDVLFEDESKVVAVNVRSCELIIAHVPERREAALLMLELGNLHWPAQIDGDEIVFVENDAAMAALDVLQIFWRKAIRRFEPVSVKCSPRVDVSPATCVIIRSHQGRELMATTGHTETRRAQNGTR